MASDPPNTLRAAVLASGSGTILEAMLDEGIPIELVVLDRTCRASDVAAARGVPVELIERTSFGRDFDRDAYTQQTIDVLQKFEIDLVVMAGYGTILGAKMFEVFEGRIINTHPALLPAFKGWHAVRDALDAGVKVTGCTVHVATHDVDAGPILAQVAVPVEAGDTEETLHERIKRVERPLFVQTVKDIMQRGSIS